jgi:putative transposase
MTQQLREAFPWDNSPRYLLRDRDKIFGKEFVDQVKAQGIKQVLSAPRSPWQRAYVERLIQALAADRADQAWRTHLALGKDAPEPRRTQPPSDGCVVGVRELGGLHHHYERRAA